MRMMFPEYYSLSKKEMSELWNKCIFTLDANVLLSIYRYTPETRDSLFKVLKKLKSRVWITHQAALEYQDNRLNVIAEKERDYKTIKDDLGNISKEIKHKIENIRHPYIKREVILGAVTRVFKKIDRELNETKEKHPKLLEKDTLREEIESLLRGKIGRPYSSKRSREIYEEGEKRYEEELPPGFKDNKKPGKKDFGDLIIWFQIIDKAKQRKSPVIFITEEQKGDWWLKKHGKTIGPRPELIREIRTKANVNFHMYHVDQFLSFANDYIKADISSDSIKETEDIRMRVPASTPGLLGGKTLLDSEIAAIVEMAKMKRERPLMTMYSNPLSLPSYDVLFGRSLKAEGAHTGSSTGGLLGSLGTEEHLKFLENEAFKLESRKKDLDEIFGKGNKLSKTDFDDDKSDDGINNPEKSDDSDDK